MKLREADKFKPYPKFKTWLYGLAKHVKGNCASDAAETRPATANLVFSQARQGNVCPLFSTAGNVSFS